MSDSPQPAAADHPCVLDQLLERLPSARDPALSQPIAVSQAAWGVGARWVGDRLELGLLATAPVPSPLVVRAELVDVTVPARAVARHAVLLSAAGDARGECDLEPVFGRRVRLRLRLLDPALLTANDAGLLAADLAGDGPLRHWSGWARWLSQVDDREARDRLAAALPRGG